MKQFIALFSLFICINTFAQKTDLVNAPENPIALKYKLEHFNLKGDVYSYDSKYYFNKEGFLIKKSDYQGDDIYTYENGKLKYDGSSLELQVNEQGYITSQKLQYVFYGYAYNEKGLLTYSTETRKADYNKPLVINTKKYSYDAQNRVIKEEEFKDDILQTITTYSYIKEGTIVKVFKKETENDKTISTEKRYKNGQLIYSKSSLDTIELKIEKKLDVKGNSIKDAYINNGKETDAFDYSIVYYSDTNKPLDYKIVIKKGSNGSLYQHIYRNGEYFYSKKKNAIRFQYRLNFL